ncbi:MAG: hypothetical protein AB7P99_12690 [Vicinamibacterales bacterium]
MRTLTGILVVVIVLLLAGVALRRAAVIEDRLADAATELVTTGAVTPATDERIDEALDLAGRVPFVGTRLQREVRLRRAEAAYWQGNYAAVAPTPGAAAAMTDEDPRLILIAANAGFRSAVQANRTAATLARSLDDVLKGYTTVVQADPTSREAAHNYEYVVRLRTLLTAGRGATVPAPQQNNMQGEAGDPPEGSRESDFNVIVPLRPEERQEQMDPGAGATFQRKG